MLSRAFRGAPSRAEESSFHLIADDIIGCVPELAIGYLALAPLALDPLDPILAIFF